MNQPGSKSKTKKDIGNGDEVRSSKTPAIIISLLLLATVATILLIDIAVRQIGAILKQPLFQHFFFKSSFTERLRENTERGVCGDGLHRL